jgi:hypothetical protein
MTDLVYFTIIKCMALFNICLIVFFFSALSAEKKIVNPQRSLRLSAAGGKNMFSLSLTYPHSKAETISIAECLRYLI